MPLAEENIQVALNTKLAAVAAANSWTVGYENKTFEPSATGALWLRSFLLRNPRVPAGIGTTAYNRHSGTFQVSIFAPIGKGYGDATRAADIIVAAFKRGTVLTAGGQEIIIEGASPAAAVPEPQWYQVPVNIRWRGDAPN